MACVNARARVDAPGPPSPLPPHPPPPTPRPTRTTCVQTNFDDDSPMRARLGRWAEGSETFSQALMLRRRKLFDVEKGFEDEKRMVMEAIEFMASLWTR